MGFFPRREAGAVSAGEVAFVPTDVLSPALQRLLQVRRVIGLRNPAHSLVKLMNPVAGPALLVSSYTHPEYAVSMANTLALTGARALLLRGTEGEVVADARRQPQIEAFAHGVRTVVVDAQSGSLTHLPELPTRIDAATTARYTLAVLNGELPVPSPIARQVQAALQALDG
jgi:anthranilate phosphoribosyltransferase